MMINLKIFLLPNNPEFQIFANPDNHCLFLQNTLIPFRPIICIFTIDLEPDRNINSIMNLYYKLLVL
jgi:hypothetical protein